MGQGAGSGMRALAAALVVIACGAAGSPAEDPARARARMVRDQIEARGVTDAHAAAALGRWSAIFVPPEAAALAYADHPLEIGDGQTIRSPTSCRDVGGDRLRGGERCWRSGPAPATRPRCSRRWARSVYTMEIVPALASRARATLRQLGYVSVEVREGNGWAGWPEEAPFDAIVVTAAPPTVPEALKSQLRDGGRLVIPVGDDVQELRLVTRHGATFEEKRLLMVRFVPLVSRP